MPPVTIDASPSPRSYAKAVAELTGPGGAFELVEEETDGIRLRNFAKRSRSLRDRIAEIAAYGDAEFLIQGERRLSYGEFARLVWGTARNLESMGLVKGDRLAILAYNSIDWIVTLFAATSLGGVVVGLNGWWVSDELEYALSDSGSRFLVVDERLYPRVADILNDLPELEKVLFIGNDPPAGTIAMSSIVASADEIPQVPIEENDPFVILYTSGTTGRPKGCITTQRGTIAQVSGILLHGLASAASGGGGAFPADGSRPSVLMTAPLFHVAGLHTGLCTAMTVGSKIVMAQGRFDPEAVMALIERERVTTWSAVPTMLHRVVYSPHLADYDLSCLTRVSVGGAPTPPETLTKAREVLPGAVQLTNGYGMTETHGVIMINSGAEMETRPTSIGHPLVFFDAKIADENGRPLADGESGELWLRSPTVTPGYWRQPEASRETITDGWLRTGDIARRDSQGFFFLVDRAKDIIIRGGENVYSVEIENCLAEHPAIDEAAVIGVADAELGERVKAIICCVEGKTIDEDSVRSHAAASLAAFKVPDIIEFRDAPLPRNPGGKILKNLLRDGGVRS